MNRELIKRALEAPNFQVMQELIRDRDTTFWVDWREEEESIVESCEDRLKTGSLKAEFEDADNAEGYEMYIRYQDRRVKVPLVFGFEDRYIALCSLNEVLWPDYELRHCLEGGGGADGMGILPLPTSDWRQLERQYGGRVHGRFHKIAPDAYAWETAPDTHTEAVTEPQPAAPAVTEPSTGSNPSRKWWQFWN